MSVKDEVLRLLENNMGQYISGGSMARELKVSRSSVWKEVKALRERGYHISALSNKGYMLHDSNPIVSAQSVEKYITARGIRVEYYDCVSSTITLAKERGEKGEAEGLLVIAGEQTAGRGRRGRSFLSRKGDGIYFSLLLRPKIPPETALLITTCAAVAVARSLEKNAGIETRIKWVNDIFCNGKKLCGILTEAAFDLEGGGISYAVLGIGINMTIRDESLPPELQGILGSVFGRAKPTGDQVSRIVADTVNFFMAEYGSIGEKRFLEDYRSRSYLTGKSINVIKGEGEYPGTALGIDDSFRLHVRYPDGSEEFLSSGEVSTAVKND